MDILPYIVPFAWLILIESLTVRWVAGGPVPGLVSRILAINVAGIVLLLFVSMMGWFNGWWPDIRNWALRDSFFLFLILKAPVFIFIFRRWGMQRIFTLHVLSNFVSALVLSMLFVYAPTVLAIRPLSVEHLNKLAESRVGEIKSAIEEYYTTHGYYPRYIWGGDIKGWDTGPSPDPLLNEGYLTAYPVNPLHLRKTYFVPRRTAGLKALWFGFKSSDFLHVRNLWEPIVEQDPRFGYRGTKMGNILPDPRYIETISPAPVDFRLEVQGRWLPGGFIYRSFDLDDDGLADAYILGVCGDENAQATIDCYDARVDRLTAIIDNRVVPYARDGRRDGVIYREKRGFISRPGQIGVLPETTENIDPETGLVIGEPPDWFVELSVGETEEDVRPEPEPWIESIVEPESVVEPPDDVDEGEEMVIDGGESGE